MNLEMGEALEAFRAEVIAFLDANVTPDLVEAGAKTTSVFAPFEQAMRWQGILAARGWAAPNWPVEHGGAGWSAEQADVFAQECERRGLPPLLPHNLKMIGPLLIDLGTPEQKAKYLPGILSGEDFWCQGYSEPNSGSDLASLRCMAVSDGDDYLITGQKIWTTYAHHANRMFLLVRTSTEGKKQQGITFLLLDSMDLPGLTVKQTIGLDGFPEQCEVFFDNVRVPKANRVGAENDGWSVAKHLLKYERGGGSPGPALRRRLAALREAAARADDGMGGVIADDPAFQERLGMREADVISVDYHFRHARGGGEPAHDPAYPSMMKTLSSETSQALSAMMIEVAGLEGLPRQLDALAVGANSGPLSDGFDMVAMPYYLNTRAASIYAGSNEIQRDLIARIVMPA